MSFCNLAKCGCRLLAIGMWWLAVTPAAAQDISIVAEAAPREASVGQQIRLQVTIEGKVNLQGSPKLPDLPDFQVYSGGRSSNFSFINGQVTSSLNFTYILVPKREGKFAIGPVEIAHAGQTYTTQPLEVSISANPGSASLPATPNRVPAPAGEKPSSEHSGQPVFITTQTDRHEVYVNQPVVMTFRFYSRIPILSQPQYQPPDTSGFWSEDLPPQREYTTTYQGQEYRVIEIKTALFPTAAGPLNIGPANLVVQVQNFQQGRDPFADDFFRGFFSMGQQVPLRSNPIAIRVKPLPETGKPGDFSGTVGRWSLSTNLDRKQAKVGDAVTLEVRIFGEGNVKSVGKPSLPAMPGFKIYETISSSEVQKQNDRVQGVKIYRTLLRPEVTGTLAVPGLTYCYFDPQSGRYERLQVPSLTLQVQPGEGGAASVSLAGAAGNAATSGTEVKVMARDIRYIKREVPLAPPPPPIAAIVLVAGFLLPPAAVAFLGWRRRFMDRLAADPRFARRLRADKSAQKILGHARAARKKHDTKAFYAALSQALMGYLADHLGLSRSGVTLKEILAGLKDLGAPPELSESMAEIIAECDFARFAPGQRPDEEMAGHERQAETLLNELMRVMAKERKK